MGDFIQVNRKRNKKKNKKDAQNKALADIKKSPEDFAQHYCKIVRTYKTEKCKEGFGKPFSCHLGKHCFKAHSETELRRDPLFQKGVPRYSRGMCQQKDNCPNGKECQFAHNDCETMYHPKTYKTKGCKNGSNCERGIFCAFKHDDDILTPELRGELFLNKDHLSEADNSSAAVDDAYQEEILEEQQRKLQQLKLQEKEAAERQKKQLEQERLQQQQQQQQLQQQQQQQRERELELERQKEEEARQQKKAEEEAERLRQENIRIQAAAAAAKEEELKQQQQQQQQQQFQQQYSPQNQSSPFSSPQQQRQQQIPPLSAATSSPVSQPDNSNLNGSRRGSSSSVGSSIISPPSPSMHPKHMKSASVIIAMLNNPNFKLIPEQAEALLDLLSGTDEGRICRDNDNSTALIAAVKHRVQSVVRALALPQTIDAVNNLQQTPITLAIEQDNQSMMEELINVGASINMGHGALVHAIKVNAVQCAYALSHSQQINVGLVDVAGNTALALSAERGLEQIVSNLCNYQSLVNLKNGQGETPLILASRNGHVSSVLVLLQRGADPNQVDNSGNSALLAALLSENGIPCVDMLLQVGNINVNTRNVNNATAILVAKQRGLGEIVRKLYEKGAQDGSPSTGSVTAPSPPLSTTSNSSRYDPLGGDPFGSPLIQQAQQRRQQFQHQQQQQQQQQQPSSMSQTGGQPKQQACLMCMQVPPTTINFPCGHRVFCNNCANKFFETQNYCLVCSNIVSRFETLSPSQPPPPLSMPQSGININNINTKTGNQNLSTQHQQQQQQQQQQNGAHSPFLSQNNLNGGGPTSFLSAASGGAPSSSLSPSPPSFH